MRFVFVLGSFNHRLIALVRLGTDETRCIYICISFFFFLAFCGCGGSFSGSRTLFTGPTNLFFLNKIFIKNGSHSNIHTFENYFTTVFSVFSKISGIQTDP